MQFLESGNDYHKHLLDRWLPESGVVADVGCGWGRVALHYTNPRRMVVGLDTGVEMIAAARRLGGLVAIADAFRLPFRDHSLDAYIGIGIVDLDPDGPRHCLAEAARVLRPHGRIYVTVAYRNLPRRLGWRVFPESCWGGMPVRQYTEAEAAALLWGSGAFRVELVRPSSLAWGLGPLRLLASVFRPLLLREDERSLSYRLFGPIARQFGNLLVLTGTKT